jgi:hypothetical protein
MSLTNAIDFEDLGPGIVYGYEFNVDGIPQSLTTQVNFNRIPGKKHPTHGGKFKYLAGRLSTNPADNRNGYKVYRIGEDGTLVEIAKPPDADEAAENENEAYENENEEMDGTTEVEHPNASTSASAAAHAHAPDEIGPRIPIGTLAESVRGASWGSILSSLVTGGLVETKEMRELLDRKAKLKEELEDQLERSGLLGHGHGSSNFHGEQAAAHAITRLRRQITEIDDRLQALYREQHLRYKADGGRLGIAAACVGQNSRTFIESRIQTLEREIATIRAEHFSSYLDFGAGPPPEETAAMNRRISGLRAQIAALQVQLRDLPREEGEGCKVSRKSRQRKSRQRKSRRRRSRATRRR